jgi:hypothetical protein
LCAASRLMSPLQWNFPLFSSDRSLWASGRFKKFASSLTIWVIQRIVGMSAG